MSFVVTFVRHAETDFNLNALTQSKSDIGINATGIAQAEALGARLANEKFTKIYSSDLIRTQDTTKIILEQSKYPVASGIVLDTNLRERDMGEWEGQDLTQKLTDLVKSWMKDSKISGNPMELDYVQLLSNMNPPGGETHEQIMTRIIKFFEELCQVCDNANEPENILVVTHGIWLISFLNYLKSNQDQKFQLQGFDSTCLSLKALIVNKGLANTCVTRMNIHKINTGNGDEAAIGQQQRKIEFQDFLNSSHLSNVCST